MMKIETGLDFELFKKLWQGSVGRPLQLPLEFLLFLEFCERYLKSYKIENPVVVELGVWKNRQKKFYKQLLGAEHISIDIKSFQGADCPPDILGDSHDSRTMDMLKEMLDGDLIDILFIDGSHYYKDVKKDYELYSPLCSDIIAFHDIDNCRYKDERCREVWKFWDELKEKIVNCEKGYEDFLAFTLSQSGYKESWGKNQKYAVKNEGIGVLTRMGKKR